MGKGKHQVSRIKRKVMPKFEELTEEELDTLEPPQTVYENFNKEQLASFSKELAKLIKKHTSQKSSPS